MTREPAKIVEKKEYGYEGYDTGLNRAFYIDDNECLCDATEDNKMAYLSCGREKLLREIQKLDFAMTETKHYLNTHPEDKRAMVYFDRHKILHQTAVRIYQEKFGPLTADGINTRKDGWSWIEAPWPWQMEV